MFVQLNPFSAYGVHTDQFALNVIAGPRPVIVGVTTAVLAGKLV